MTDKPDFEIEPYRLDSFKAPVDHGFVIDDENVNFDWGHSGYWIALDRLKKPEQLLALVAHLGAKNWKGMTPNRIAAFIRAVQSLRGWERFF